MQINTQHSSRNADIITLGGKQKEIDQRADFPESLNDRLKMNLKFGGKLRNNWHDIRIKNTLFSILTLTYE